VSSAPPDAPPFEAEVDYWDSCSLTTVLTDPPTHELALPSGRTLRLRTSHFFDLRQFRIAYIDAVGVFPPLPREKAGAFLQELFERLLTDRKTVEVAEEAGNRGTLLGDIRLAIRACPETEDPRDLERGSLLVHEDGTTWVNARTLLARVSRACPVRFTPGDFYSALRDVGLTNLGVQRVGTWVGRVWLVPGALLPVVALPEHTNGAVHQRLEEHAGDFIAQPGIFDDLIGKH
jgi:hypothetical protein